MPWAAGGEVCAPTMRRILLGQPDEQVDVGCQQARQRSLAVYPAGIAVLTITDLPVLHKSTLPRHQGDRGLFAALAKKRRGSEETHSQLLRTLS